MAKPEKLCAGCAAPLTFMSTPNFSSGYLKDGGRVCRDCMARIVKVDPSFGLRSKKDHTTESVQMILRPGPGQADQHHHDQKTSVEQYTPDKMYTNHLRGFVWLSRKVFDLQVAQQSKLEVAHMLHDLFEYPNEVWELEMEDPRHAWRYVKYYQEGALFGMVDIERMDHLNVVDWYFLKHDKDAPEDTAQADAIEAQRTGKLTYSKFEGDPPETHDPVPFLLDALTSGKDPEGALAATREAHNRWWAMDCTDREYSHEELMDMLDVRAFVLASVATVYVWNKEFAIADRIQPEFIYHESLWKHEQRRDAIELYLIHLLFQEQFERVETIFAEAAFKKEFLCYHDLYKSVMDPHYEFQSKQGPFLNVVNKVNHYCRQIGRKTLF